jgi:hypothetical protein
VATGRIRVAEAELARLHGDAPAGAARAARVGEAGGGGVPPPPPRAALPSRNLPTPIAGPAAWSPRVPVNKQTNKVGVPAVYSGVLGW